MNQDMEIEPMQKGSKDFIALPRSRSAKRELRFASKLMLPNRGTMSAIVKL